MFFTLNRIEENTIAVLIDDNGSKTDIPLSALRKDCRTGDVYEFSDGMYIYNEKETRLRRESAREKLNRLLRKN